MSRVSELSEAFYQDLFANDVVTPDYQEQVQRSQVMMVAAKFIGKGCVEAFVDVDIQNSTGDTRSILFAAFDRNTFNVPDYFGKSIGDRIRTRVFDIVPDATDYKIGGFITPINDPKAHKRLCKESAQAIKQDGREVRRRAESELREYRREVAGQRLLSHIALTISLDDKDLDMGYYGGRI